MLVGSYRQIEALNRAVEEFAAAAFATEDAMFVCAYPAAKVHWWKRLRDWARERFVDGAGDAPQFPIEFDGADELLASGGGFVLVRCPARFHQACEIIERTGGRVGLANALAA